jgi:hypothetical protein
MRILCKSWTAKLSEINKLLLQTEISRKKKEKGFQQTRVNDSKKIKVMNRNDALIRPLNRLYVRGNRIFGLTSINNPFAV